VEIFFKCLIFCEGSESTNDFIGEMIERGFSFIAKNGNELAFNLDKEKKSGTFDKIFRKENIENN